jgi:hypothetical protein
MKFSPQSYFSFLLAALGVTFAAALFPVSAQVLAPGDLVVSAYGTPGSSGLIDGQAVPISLQVFTPSVTASGESPTSTTVLSGIVGEYGSSSEGNIELTGNGQGLTIAGYNAAQAAAGIGSNTNGDNGNGTYAIGTPYGGTAATGGSYSNSSATPLAQSSPADVARLADVIDFNGNVVSSTSFSNLYNTNNARSAYSPDGNSIYISGQGDKSSSDQGIFYSPTTGTSYSGSNPATGIYNANDTRSVEGYNGNLYYSLDKKNNPTGIFKYSGLPTSGGATATQVTTGENLSSGTGFTLDSYNSPEGFWFANSTTLYVADTGIPKKGGSVSGAGGIQKWTLNGSTWQLDYVLRPSSFISPSSAVSASSGETGFEAITGEVVGNTVDLFAVSYTASDDNPNGLYALADSLSATSITPGSETFDELSAAPGSGAENFKGVVFLATPEPASWMLGLGACTLFVALSAYRRRA